MASVVVKDLSINYGSTVVVDNLNLEVERGEFLVLLGPSGCGKSTLLNAIAGLVDISSGQIMIGGNNVTWAEPKDRGIGMVFQSYALYPQMTVRGNMSFGLKNQGLPIAEVNKRVASTAELLQIEALLDRKPAALSGGQRQRVAIGRALVRDVDVFLFDEPLSNLDAKLRTELRVELKRLHAQLNQTTMIYVTHDQIEAMTLANRIAILKGGHIQQLDAPQTIYRKPTNLFVGGFIGSPSINCLEGSITAETFKLPHANLDLKGYNGTLPTSHAQAILGIRPEHFTVSAEEVLGRTIKATVDIDEPMGNDSVLWLKTETDQVIAVKIDSSEHYERGTQLNLAFEPSQCSIFDQESEKRF